MQVYILNAKACKYFILIEYEKAHSHHHCIMRMIIGSPLTNIRKKAFHYNFNNNLHKFFPFSIKLIWPFKQKLHSYTPIKIAKF